MDNILEMISRENQTMFNVFKTITEDCHDEETLLARYAEVLSKRNETKTLEQSLAFDGFLNTLEHNLLYMLLFYHGYVSEDVYTFRKPESNE